MKRNITHNPIEEKNKTAAYRHQGRVRRLYYGGYSAAITAIVIAAVVLLNILATQLEDRYALRLDLTSNRMYSLQKQTTDLLATLKEPIRIYSCYPAGREDTLIREILLRYQADNPLVTVENIDPVKNPNRIAQFTADGSTNISNGAVIVSNAQGSKYRVLSMYDLYAIRQNASTGNYEVAGVQAEAKVTSAITYITDERTPVVYFLTGHSETRLFDLNHLASALRDENYEPKEINLLVEGGRLQPGDTLVVIAPKEDLAEQERETLRKFLRTGGRAIFCFDVLQQPMPRFETLPGLFGVTVNNDLIYEMDTAYFTASQINLVPAMHSHEITNPISGANRMVVIPKARSLGMPDTEKTGITVKPLLSTSAAAYGKVNLASATGSKEEGDHEGPLVVAAAIQYRDLENSGNDANVVVFGSSAFLDQLDHAANRDVFLNSVNWVQGKTEGTTIRAKSISGNPLEITVAQMNTVAGLVIIAIPVAVFACGLVVWLKRRHL